MEPDNRNRSAFILPATAGDWMGGFGIVVSRRLPTSALRKGEVCRSSCFSQRRCGSTSVVVEVRNQPQAKNSWNRLLDWIAHRLFNRAISPQSERAPVDPVALWFSVTCREAFGW